MEPHPSSRSPPSLAGDIEAWESGRPEAGGRGQAGSQRPPLPGQLTARGQVARSASARQLTQPPSLPRPTLLCSVRTALWQDGGAGGPPTPPDFSGVANPWGPSLALPNIARCGTPPGTCKGWVGKGGAGFFSCGPCQRTLRGLLIGRWRHGGKLVLRLAEDIGVRTSRGSRIHRASPAPWQAAPKRWRRPRGSAGSGTPSHLEVPPGLWRLGPGRLPAYFPAMSPRGRDRFSRISLLVD